MFAFGSPITYKQFSTLLKASDIIFPADFKDFDMPEYPFEKLGLVNLEQDCLDWDKNSNLMGFCHNGASCCSQTVDKTYPFFVGWLGVSPPKRGCKEIEFPSSKIKHRVTEFCAENHLADPTFRLIRKDCANCS
jgi:hypothetical protein